MTNMPLERPVCSSNETLTEIPVITRPQTPKEISNALLDWMEELNLDYRKAGEYLRVGNSVIVAALNSAPLNPHLILKFSNYIPGIHTPKEFL